MSHEQLWAPWRIGYIQGTPSPSPGVDSGANSSSPNDVDPKQSFDWLDGANHDCFLCRCVADADTRRTLTVRQNQFAIACLNRYPYNNGHLLVAPRTHKARLDELSNDEQLATVQMLAELTGTLERLIHCDGFNIGLNLGRVAGAGVPGHLHWHIVPRWHGDTNFMPVLADTSVIPQSLEALYDLLRVK